MIYRSINNAYTEMDTFLELLNADDRNKVPIEIREIFKTEKDHNYVKKIDIAKPISEQELKEETLSLIALLNLKYWCNDESEKSELKQIYMNNENCFKEFKI